MTLPASLTTPIRVAALLGALALTAGAAAANPSLVVDFDTGQALSEVDATEPWYPASLTKLVTTYVALQAVRDGRLTLDTPLTMSARAAAAPASKMGFVPGTEVTLDNALKMLMVKSPNDVAIMIAESLSGSVEAFADEMNATARKLGMRESHFVNPNGLHDPNHFSSARDMAIVARALLLDFPDQRDLYDIGALQLGRIIIANHNGLIGRYPGADGMKTGFTCPAGFNVVATATRGGRRLIVVVLGAPSPLERTLEAARLFDAGFAKSGGGEGPLESLPDSTITSAPDMRGEICSRRNRAAVLAAEE
jgi:D-alanyl-D-alanine carboxypeptidase